MPDIAPAEQLDLFADAPLPLIMPDPCGRGRGRCEAVYELGPSGPQLHCVDCDCIAPAGGHSRANAKLNPDHNHQRDPFMSMSTVTDHRPDPFMVIIEGYRLAQLHNLNSGQPDAEDERLL